MGVIQTLYIESSNVTDMPVAIPFEFTNKESIPKGKTTGSTIVVTPITVRTWFRIKPLIAQLQRVDGLSKITAGTGKEFDASALEIMEKYDELLFEIICIGIHNKKGDMPAWFKETLKDNSTFEDLYILLNAILFRIAHNPFLNSITALKAVSPLGEEEMIALQKNQESWIKKTKEKIRKAASCS